MSKLDLIKLASKWFRWIGKGIAKLITCFKFVLLYKFKALNAVLCNIIKQGKIT